MQSATARLDDLSLSEVEDAVGSPAFERGDAYARQGRVLEVAWEPDGLTLTGTVAGKGARYTTTAFFVEADDGALEFEDGECSCPMGWNCKHVAAVVIAAPRGRPAAAGRRSARAVGVAVARPPRRRTAPAVRSRSSSRSGPSARRG